VSRLMDRARQGIGRAALATATAALLLPAGVGIARGANASQPMIDTDAPAFELATVAGDTVGLADLKGRYVVLHFGASW